MANVFIDIAAEFTGNKAFKQAETATEKLTRNVKQLAGAIGLSFGTAQVLAFGKAAVKASLEAQAQQERLANLVKVTVGATDSQIQSLNDQAAALQAIGVVNKENITQTQSQLATFNLQIDTIKALTPAILDYVTAEKGAAASASEFKSMTNGLAQALNGNFASLTKVGFVLDDVTKKTIKEGTETERAAALVKVLDSTYKDFNKNLANTPTGQMQKLANAADDAKETIGTGLLDALKSIGEDTSVESLATNMQNIALYVADVTRGIGKLTAALKNIPVLGNFNVGMIPIVGSYLNILREAGVQAGEIKASDNAHLKSLQNQFTVMKKINNISTKLTADELKKLKAKKLQNAIDKANLALNKGEEVFDMDKIQIAAALTNQAEQLGKATTSSQVLQIANDTARLNVKRSILAVEDAIASKDEAAIDAAVKRLNADLGILGALNNQKLTLGEIDKLIKSLQATDLKGSIQYTDNITETLNKLRSLYSFQIDTENQLTALRLRNIRDVANAENDTLERKLRGYSASALALASLAGAERQAAIARLSSEIGTASLIQGIQAGMTLEQAAVGARYAAQAAFNYYIEITTGIGDPNAIAAAVNDVLTQAQQRGTLVGGVFAA